jgi:DNA/RNA-binding domain of Phe-tRNA-synthetase-like protein
MNFEIRDAWKQAYPGAATGVLVMAGVTNPARNPALEEKKKALETSLRQRYAGYDRGNLSALEPFPAYQVYYKRFKKTYHVYLQFESLVLKDRPIPSVAALVEAMFMAELKNRLLTAGHDLDNLHMPVVLDVARGDETYEMMNGSEQQLKAGDMFISDQVGVISSVIYGPDRRSQINPRTQNVLFTTYAPPGIQTEAVKHHLEDIREDIFLTSPDARVIQLQVYTTF